MQSTTKHSIMINQERLGNKSMSNKSIICNGIFLLCFGICAAMAEDAQKIGMQIWQNEASGRTDLLVFWNPHESFPSLGIGHFIWHPKKGNCLTFAQQFPALCDYLQQHGIKLPTWLEKAKHAGAPWNSRNEFLQDEQKIKELRQLLSTTMDLQTNFMIEQLEKQLPKIFDAVPEEQKEHVGYCVALLQSCPLGTYALVDYLNFKGSGLNPKERSNDQGWGLLQVLLAMPENITAENVCQAFAIAAAKILLRRIENAAPDYKPLIFLHGWIKRVSTYAKPDIFQ